MKIFRFLGSIKLSLVLFLVFAFGAGAATFIEAKFGTPTAWALVYGAWWFGAVQVLLGINLFAAIFRYKMYEKLPLFVFHLSFLFMLLGSVLTRFYGFEGSIHLRSGESSNLVSSRDKFLILANEQESISKPLALSLIGGNFASLELDGAKLVLEKVIPQAKAVYKPAASGNSAYVFNISADAGSAQVVLSEDDPFIILGDTLLKIKGAAAPKFAKQIEIDDKSLSADFDLKLINTSDLSSQDVKADSRINFLAGQMIDIPGYKITAAQLLAHASKEYEQSDDNTLPTILKLLASKNGEQKNIFLAEDAQKAFSLDGQRYMISYGSKMLELDFKIRLDEFKLEHYLGSNSPKSYESFVSILRADGSEQKAHIFMNNVLDFEGFRFFQSSYDQDLKGSILSINQDPGKAPTYIGYFLLGLGLLLNIISPNSRFRQLAKQISKLSAAVLLLCVLPNNLRADELSAAIENASAKLAPVSLESHAKNLELLGVKRYNGRVAPFEIEAASVLAKISHKSDFHGENATKFMIKLMSDFEKMKDEKIILVHNKEVAKMLGISGKFASFSDFFQDDKYKLIDEVNKALRTSEDRRSSLQKDLLKIDERINTLYFASLGGFLTAINDNETFKNPLDAKNPSGRAYLLALISGAKSGNFALADEILSRIESEQGAKLEKGKFALEISFSKLNIFSKFIGAYLLCGLGLLVVVFVQIFSLKECRLVKNIFYALNILLFICMCAALAMRGYLAGHAPWSNSYESLLYIAATLSLAGIVFARRSAISLALSSVLAGVVLFVAHLGSIDPQIGNLAPVLSSIWLSIHVSVITASYGFLGLCALLGLFSLVLFALANERNAQRIKRSIKEASKINEMAMILGLSLLVMGNFLGGVWANESWGRYWGWDSKETWALVSILIYAVVLHARMIKALNNQFIFALLSLFAYYVIVMTYFGVNYFLAGMHSYAAGNAASVPAYAYFITGGLIVLAILAARKKSLAERL